MIIPTRPIPWSKTLDNILHNGIKENTISRNIMTDFSYHFVQVLIELLHSYSVLKENLKKKITKKLKSLNQDNVKCDLQIKMGINPRQSTFLNSLFFSFFTFF